MDHARIFPTTYNLSACRLCLDTADNPDTMDTWPDRMTKRSNSIQGIIPGEGVVPYAAMDRGRLGRRSAFVNPKRDFALRVEVGARTEFGVTAAVEQ